MDSASLFFGIFSLFFNPFCLISLAGFTVQMSLKELMVA